MKKRIPSLEFLLSLEFLKIAFPAILESLVSVIIATIDTKMIACLGKPAISAVSFTTQPKLIFSPDSLLLARQ